MLFTALVAGVAHARLFSAPAPNVASQQAYMPVENVVSPQTYMPVEPQLQQQVFVEAPTVVLQPQAASSGSVFSLGAALLAAGVGVVAGRTAILFMSSGKSSGSPAPKRPTSKGGMGSGTAGGRPTNRGGPYSANKQNIQTQRNGFGSFVQKFQLAGGKSKYGMPIFLPNGNVNPAYLAAERKELQAQSKLNSKATEAKRKGLIKKKAFELADYVRKAVGPVGSGKDYYQSGR